MSTDLATHGLAKQLFVASRPISWINTAYPFAASYYLATGRIAVPLVVGTLFFLVPYNLALYGINDVFDYESDLANPRKGGVEGAVLDRRIHRATLIAATVVCVPFVIVLAWWGTSAPWSWPVLAISLFAVAAYSVPGLRFKEVPFLDSVTSSTHFVSPAAYGIALAGAPVTGPLMSVLAAFFLWGVASHAFGAVQDVLPDREGGIRSIATVIGARWSVRFAIATWTVAGVLVLFAPWPGRLAAVLAVPYIAMAAPFWSVPDTASEAANRGWRKFIGINYAVGFVVTLLLIGYAVTRS